MGCQHTMIGLLLITIVTRMGFFLGSPEPTGNGTEPSSPVTADPLNPVKPVFLTQWGS